MPTRRSWQRVSIAVTCFTSFLFTLANPLSAGITYTGNVTPDPARVTSLYGLTVGGTYDGTMRVDDGSVVESSAAFIGREAGVSGSVVIEGGSTWTNSYNMRVGYQGNGSLTIADNAHFQGNDSWIGSEPGSVGEVIIDGSGSTWKDSSRVSVGSLGSGILSITNGGHMDCRQASIAPTPGSLGNVTVDGTGSFWGSNSSLDIAYSGIGTLNITNGGVVAVHDDTWVGANGGQGMIHFHDGTLSTEALAASPSQLSGTGTINVLGLLSDVDLILDGSHGRQQQLILNEQPGQNITVNLDLKHMPLLGAGYAAEGSLTFADDMIVYSGWGCLGYLAGSTGTAVVSGADSPWNPGSATVWHPSTITVGYGGAGVLTIADGGRVSTLEAMIGWGAGSAGAVTVDGNSSTWISDHQLHVGMGGSGSLAITHGGKVSVTLDTFVGEEGGQGSIHFDGGKLITQSLLAGLDQLSGHGVIDTNGLVSDVDLVFDQFHGFSQQIVLNSRPDQDITINLDMNDDRFCRIGAGYRGEGSLTVTDRVVLDTSFGYGQFGYLPGSTGTGMVSGGASWSMGSLEVGIGGNGSLSIVDGSKVNCGNGYVGYEPGSNGTVTVDGADSIWTASTSVFIGHNGNGSLNITGGGKVSYNRGDGYLGYESGSTGTATVDGDGSSLSIRQDLYVGDRGDGSLAILRGGLVEVGRDTYVGYDGGQGVIHFDDGALHTRSLFATPSQLLGVGTVETMGLVSDVDLIFDASHAPQQELIIGDLPDHRVVIKLNAGYGHLGAGYAGRGSLTVTDGRAVAAATGYLGYLPGSVGTATIDGPGSTWAAHTLYIGHRGTGTLLATNGGSVDMSGDLYVGYGGSGSLLVTNNGHADTQAAYIGQEGGATGTVAVTGTGATWNNDEELLVSNGSSLSVSETGAVEAGKVLRVQSGTLSVTGGGRITCRSADLGYFAVSSSSTATAVVDGPSSIWRCERELKIGDRSVGNLTISNGGLVEVSEGTFVGQNGGYGVINFNGGTLSTHDLWAGANQLVGSGTVNTHGIVTDAHLVFDRAHGLQHQQILGNPAEQYIAVNLDVDGTGVLGAGYNGAGSLSIADGLHVSSSDGYLGFLGDATGTATIAGASSAWDCDDKLYVGYGGDGTLTLTDGGVATAGSVTVGHSHGYSGTVTIDGAGSLLTSSYLITVAEYGHGTLDIVNGGTVQSNNAYIAQQSGSTATITVAGPGSTWNDSGTVFLSTYGRAELRILDGGAVNCTLAKLGSYWDLPNAVVVSGIGSTLSSSDTLYLGSHGRVKLTVTDSGRVNSASSYVGFDTRSTGEVVVVGSGSSWTSDSYITVGYQGTGSITITDGGQVFSSSGNLGVRPDGIGRVTIDGVGSAWTASNSLSIGGEGNAALTISRGGQVHSGATYVANRGDGQVTVDGNGSVWTNSGELRLAYGGSGLLEVTGGGFFSNNETCYIGYKEGSHGYLTVDGDGSEWIEQADVFVGYQGEGTLTITGGGLVDVNGNVSLSGWRYGTGTLHLAGGTLRMHGGSMGKHAYGNTPRFLFAGGRLEGVGTIDLGQMLVQEGGALAPGNSAGTTTIEGGYTLSDGALEIEINGLGTAGTDWDLVNVNGTVDLVGGDGTANGMLNVVLGFAPAAGDAFLVLANNGIDPIVGTFANGSRVFTSYGGRRYRFAIDYAGGDGNDIVLTATVPEPSSLALVALAALIAAVRRRGRRRTRRYAS